MNERSAVNSGFGATMGVVVAGPGMEPARRAAQQMEQRRIERERGVPQPVGE